MLGIIGASGKLGLATLDALLIHNLIPASEIVCTTSSSPSDAKWRTLADKGVHVRAATFDDAQSIEHALAGCDKLFLVSSPRISMDFNDAPPGSGREKDHFVAIDAARRSGVKHIYYTSLAFGSPSKAGVMRAHMRTEEYLSGLKDVTCTIIREGLYNESWPLYLGHYGVGQDERSIVPVGGDSRISWTAIKDLGLANAMVLSAPSKEHAGKTFYLSNTQEPRTLKEVAELVSKSSGKDVQLKIVSRVEHERYYVGERKMPEAMVKWWASTYDALRDGECTIEDTTFNGLLARFGVKPKRVEETVAEMVNAGR